MKKYYYNPQKFYKKFKSIYPKFIVCIKSKDYLITYGVDAHILNYITNTINNEEKFIFKKTNLINILNILDKCGLNLVVAGSKKTREYYSTKPLEYDFYKRKIKFFLRLNKL